MWYVRMMSEIVCLLNTFLHFLVQSCIFRLSDSNPIFSDSNPFSSNQNIFKQFESLFQGFESDFQQLKSFQAIQIYFLVAKTFLGDSNPFFEDSNSFSNSSIVFKRFESFFRGFESLRKKPKNFKIFNTRFESLFRRFESPYLLMRETVQFLQNPTVSFPKFSLNPLSNLSQKCFKSKFSSKPTLIPISYHHITSFHPPKCSNQL